MRQLHSHAKPDGDVQQLHGGRGGAEPDLQETAERAAGLQDGCNLYSSSTAKQIQSKFNGTAGPQAIAKSMGLPAAAVTVESPPQLTVVQVNAPAPPPAQAQPSPPASPASGPNVGVIQDCRRCGGEFGGRGRPDWAVLLVVRCRTQHQQKGSE